MTAPEKPTQTVNPTPGDSAPSNSKRFNWLSQWPSKLPQLYFFIWLWTIPMVCALGIGVTLIYTSQVPGGVRWSVFGTALAIGCSAYFTAELLVSCLGSHAQCKELLSRKGYSTRAIPTWSRSPIG